MYLWKAWRDTRSRLALYSLAGVALGVLCGSDVLASANYRHLWHANGRWDFDSLIFSGELYWLEMVGLAAALFTGLLLGATSVGRAYGEGAMSFVLTRPAARRNLVLVDWTVGLTGVVISLSGLVYVVYPFLSYVEVRGPGNILGILPALWLVGAAVFGLAHFTTLVGGSLGKGLILSVAVVLSYGFFPSVLQDWWHVDFLSKPVDWTFRILECHRSWPFGPFEWTGMFFWLAVTVGFFAASVAWIRYREV